MARSDQTTAAGQDRPASLLPTAMGLTVLFLGSLYLVRSIESGLISGMVALLSGLVAFLGVVGHGLSGLWAGFAGRGAVARRRFSRAAVYLGFGALSFVAARLQGGTVERFRAGLEPGTSLQEVLRRLDALYSEHPRRWRFISLWGTSQDLTLDGYPRIGQTNEGALYTWSAGLPRSTGAVAETAAALSRNRQIWFTFRTDVGFVHFFVTLDDRGLVKTISKTIGHQA